MVLAFYLSPELLITPDAWRFYELEAAVPIKDGMVELKKKGGVLKAKPGRTGGILVVNSREYVLEQG